jgi:tripartite-type tricarboxylate transporter receptor subunit TctC
VKAIIGFAAGGQIDAVARIVSHKVGESLSQPLILENRPGAGSNIAAEIVAKSPADGYTIYFATQSVATNPVLMRAGAVDPRRQLAPITMLATAEAVLMVHPSVPAKTVKELVAYAKSRPGELNFATTSVGSPAHVGMELLKKLGGVQMESILYKNVSQASSDVSAGRVKVWMTLLTPALPLIKSGALRPIGVTGSNRLEALPNVPTIKESGFPDFESSSWYGLFAPAGTPRDVVAKISTDFNKALKDPEVEKRLAGLSVDARGTTPEVLARYVNDELARVESLVKAGALTTH